MELPIVKKKLPLNIQASFILYGVLRSALNESSNGSAIVEWFAEKCDVAKSTNVDRISTPTALTINDASYAVFDSQWNPIELHGKKTNMDTATILLAAQQLKDGEGHDVLNRFLEKTYLENCVENNSSGCSDDDANKTILSSSLPCFPDQKIHSSNFLQPFHNWRRNFVNSNDDTNGDDSNTNRSTGSIPFYRSEIDLELVTSMVQDGSLPLVPVKRSSIQQFLIQRSVDLFFHPASVRVFACQPYRFSPRTIYRFPPTVQTKQSANKEPQQYPSGYIALTIDDAPCRLDSRQSSKLPQVLDLLDRYNAKATFMVIEQFLSQAHESDLIRLLLQGHEMANHGVQDVAMSSTKDYATAEEFAEAVRRGNQRIEELQDKARNRLSDLDRKDDAHTNVGTIQSGVKWFRAPHGKYTKLMEDGLEALDMYNVMCDVYAVDPVVEDGDWISQSLVRQAKDGSIILIHMPEKGFREYCFTALEQLLEELCTQRGYKIVTVSELQRISEAYHD